MKLRISIKFKVHYSDSMREGILSKGKQPKLFAKVSN